MIANVQHWTDLIAKKVSGNIREDEARILAEWLARDPEHMEYYEQLLQVWQVTARVPGTQHLPESDWDGLIQELNTPAKRPLLPEMPVLRTSWISWRAVAAIAAVALLGVLVLGRVYQGDTIIDPVIVAEAGPDSVTQLMLPDGSNIVLRQGSTLTYIHPFAERSVVLTGEAFFDVVHDEERPFTVEGGNGFVRVLGTRFNVKVKADASVELYVEEGRVAFAPATHKFDAKIFSAGQTGILASAPAARVERTVVAGANLSSWTTGRLVFNHVRLDHVMADLQRHFDIPLDVADPGLLSCELKADFENASLDDVLETLRFSLNLKIHKAGDTYVISGTPCATPSSQ